MNDASVPSNNEQGWQSDGQTFVESNGRRWTAQEILDRFEDRTEPIPQLSERALRPTPDSELWLGTESGGFTRVATPLDLDAPHLWVAWPMQSLKRPLEDDERVSLKAKFPGVGK